MKNVKIGNSKPVVCLDAGHYGNRYNAGAVAGYYESAVMWNLCNYLAMELEALGIRVTKTRSTQADMDLIARGKASKGADLFISLHSNAEKTGKADYPLGIFFVDDNCGVIDEQSKEIARLLSGVAANVMGTKQTARIWTRSSGKDRDGNGYNDDYYGVLRGAHAVGTTGIILEHSYHTNAAAAAWLLNTGNLQRLAKAEAAKIAEWFDVSKTDATTSTATTTKKGDTYTMEMRILKKGCEGEDVRAAQILLNGRGFSCGNADGIFGDRTEDAVEACQKKYGLTRDKIIGPATMGALLGQ